MRLNKELIDKGIEAMVDVLNGGLVIEAGNKIGHNGQWVRTFIEFFLYTAHDSKRFIMPRRPKLYHMRQYAEFWLSIIPEVTEMLYTKFPSVDRADYLGRQIEMGCDVVLGMKLDYVAAKHGVTAARVQQIVNDLFKKKLTGFPADKPVTKIVRGNKKHWLMKLHEYSLTTKENINEQ